MKTHAHLICRKHRLRHAAAQVLIWIEIERVGHQKADAVAIGVRFQIRIGGQVIGKQPVHERGVWADRAGGIGLPRRNGEASYRRVEINRKADGGGLEDVDPEARWRVALKNSRGQLLTICERCISNGNNRCGESDACQTRAIPKRGGRNGGYRGWNRIGANQAAWVGYQT